MVLPLLGGFLVVNAARSGAGQTVPRQPIGPLVATSPVAFRAITQLVTLSDGRVLVNDPLRRQVILLDSTLALATIVLDSVAGRENSYGSATGVLLPFRGDSALFNDRVDNTLLVLGPRGTICRVMAAPLGGTPTMFSPRLGMFYTTSMSLSDAVPESRRLYPAVGEPDNIIEVDDSLLVASLDLATRSRRIDTVATIASGDRVTLTLRANHKGSTTFLAPPFPYIDASVVVSDGSLALLRSREYRLEWINADGTRALSPKLPFDWHPLPDAERTRLTDSINLGRTTEFATRLTTWVADSAAGTLQTTSAVTYTAGGTRLERQVKVPRPVPPLLVDVADVPQYLPPTSRGAVVADADDNVWIRLLPFPPATDADAIYDVVNRQGALLRRVTVPAGHTIIGLTSGFVFLSSANGGTITLEKHRIQ